MSSGVENQMISKVKQSKWFFFSRPTDESTDMDDKAVLLVYVKYIDCEKNFVSQKNLWCAWKYQIIQLAMTFLKP